MRPVFMIGNIAMVILAATSGCSCQKSQYQPVMIDKLPSGWKLIPSSKMPPIDRLGWWRSNPQVVRYPDTKDVIVWGGSSVSPQVVLAAAYEKGIQRVFVMNAQYASAAEAQAELQKISGEPVPDGMAGLSSADPKSILVIAMSEDIDRGPFERWFKSRVVKVVAVQDAGAAASQPVPDSRPSATTSTQPTTRPGT